MMKRRWSAFLTRSASLSGTTYKMPVAPFQKPWLTCALVIPSICDLIRLYDERYEEIDRGGPIPASVEILQRLLARLVFACSVSATGPLRSLDRASQI